MKMQGAHHHGGHSHLHKRHGDWSGGNAIFGGIGPPNGGGFGGGQVGGGGPPGNIQRPGTTPSDSETTGNGDVDPTGSGSPGASTTTTTGAGFGLVPSQTSGPSTGIPLPTSTLGVDIGGSNSGPGGAGGPGHEVGDDPLAGTATSRLSGGSIAGLVVGLLALFAILVLLFYKFRDTPFGQRVTQFFSSVGGAGKAALGGTAGAAVAAAAIVSRKEKDEETPQPQMGEKRHIPPPIAVAPAASVNPFSDNHRLSANSPFSDAYRVTTPSPTPPSDAGNFSPKSAAAAAAAANKPLPTPPRFSAMTAGSTTSVGTTILSPSVLSFPMPPMTPPITATTMSPRTPSHPQAQSPPSNFISMDQPGKTVVRITRKPVPGRDSP